MAAQDEPAALAVAAHLLRAANPLPRRLALAVLAALAARRAGGRGRAQQDELQQDEGDIGRYREIWGDMGDIRRLGFAAQPAVARRASGWRGRRRAPSRGALR